MCKLGNREKRLSNVTNAIFLGETRKLKGELPKIIPKPQILKENERTLTKKMSEIVPNNERTARQRNEDKGKRDSGSIERVH